MITKTLILELMLVDVSLPTSGSPWPRESGTHTERCCCCCIWSSKRAVQI